MTLSEKKKLIFDFCKITDLHEKGYLGQGMKILSMEGRSKGDESHSHLVIQTIRQVAPEAEIIYYDGTQNSYFSDIEEVIDHAIEQGVHVITSSVSYSITDERKAAIKKAYNAGIIFLNIAGNNNNKEVKKTDKKVYALDEVLAVGAITVDTDYNVTLAKYENNKGTNYGEGVDIVAPDGLPIDKYGDDNEIDDNWYGQSCATPLLAGMLLLYRQINNNINSKNIREFIEQYANIYLTYPYLQVDLEDLQNFKKGVNKLKSPYKKSYRITQHYSTTHTGVDLVGEDKYIYSVSNGVVDYCGWENPNNKNQGFGMYIRIKGTDGLYYYYGHLNWIHEDIKVGSEVNQGTLLGLEGNTGKSTGSHLHLEVRRKVGVIVNMSDSVNVEEMLHNETDDLLDSLYKIKKVFSEQGIDFNYEWWCQQWDTENKIFNDEVLKYIDELLIKVISCI